MNAKAFIAAVSEALPIGQTFENPGGGISTIESYSSDHLVYRRGDSSIRVSLLDLHGAYVYFCGESVSSSDLKKYNPSVFDSKAGGHSCNCTTFFRILESLCLCSPIEGAGVRGSPFRVQIFAQEK